MTKFLSLVLFLLVSNGISAQSAEICGNGIDDDGDTLVDCSDEDCVYSSFVTVLGDAETYEVAIGDIDNDGDLDVISANPNSSNACWFNLGNGDFDRNSVTIGSPLVSTHDLKMGDVDGDGDLDIWFANHSLNGLAVSDQLYINQGDGNFADSGQFFGEYRSEYVCLGDVDNDGDLDSVVAVNGQPNRVYLNDGLGVFEDSAQSLGGASGATLHVSMGDVDSDGDLDLYFCNFSASDELFLNNGLGIYSPGPFVSAGSGSRGSDFGDLDNDGDLDLVVAFDNLIGAGQSKIYLNAGSGNFSDSGQDLFDNGSNVVKIVDFDNDGWLDFWLGKNWNSLFYKNSGAGNFQQNGSHIHNQYILRSGAFADFNGDSDLEFLAVTSGKNRIYYPIPNSVTGFFRFLDTSLVIDFSSSYASDVELGDVDGDGDIDAWVTNSSWTAGNQVFLNEGDGTFSSSVLQIDGSQSEKVALGDLDGDGDLDAFVAVYDGSSQVMFNDGMGNYSDSGQVFSSYFSKSCLLADLDSDGDLDAVLANSNQQGNSVLLNNGLGGFVDSGLSIGSADSNDVSSNDMNLDGHLDLIFANSGSPSVLYLNNGSGGFVYSGNQFNAGDDSLACDVADLDNDGNLDIWFAKDGPDRVYFGFNSGGSVSFSSPGISYGSGEGSEVVLRDLNGDGFIDSFVANKFPGGNTLDRSSIWINDGFGFFNSSNTEKLYYGNHQSVDLADLDGDGDLDAFIVDDTGPHRTYLNKAPCLNDNDGDGITNLCDIDEWPGPDCDGNGEIDSCQSDSDSDGVIDACDGDLDGDGVPNECDLDLGGEDCNLNGIADNCDADLNSDGIPDDCQDPLFRRGDPNGDGSMDIGDGVTVLGYLFGSTSIDCFDAGDSNDDGNLNIADAITILSALFTGGDSPPEPGPVSCDLDPTTDSLGCESYENCS